MKVKLLIASTLVLGVLSPAFSKNVAHKDRCETKETRAECNTPENKEKKRLMEICNDLKNKKDKHDKECNVPNHSPTGELKVKCDLAKERVNETKAAIKKACKAPLESPPKGEPYVNCWKYVAKGTCADEGGILVSESGNPHEHEKE